MLLLTHIRAGASLQRVQGGLHRSRIDERYGKQHQGAHNNTTARGIRGMRMHALHTRNDMQAQKVQENRSREGFYSNISSEELTASG